MPPRLTRDAGKLLIQLYKLYLERRKSGISKREAREFGSYANIIGLIDTSLSADDLNDTLIELKFTGYINALFADDVCCESELTDLAIVTMENRFKDNLTSVISFLAGLK